jgi:hypothetical protein
VEDVKYLGRVLEEAPFKGSVGFEMVVCHGELCVWRVMPQDWGASNKLLVNRDVRTVLMAIGWRVFRSILGAVKRAPNIHPGHVFKGKAGLLAPA